MKFPWFALPWWMLLGLGDAFLPSPFPNARSSTKHLAMKLVLDTLEDMLFPTTTTTREEVDPHKQFLQQDFAANDTDTARSSLVFFLNQWAMQLATDKPTNNGLSTPITVNEFKPLLPFDDNNATTTTTLQMKIMFRPPPRYLSYNEQKSMEKGVLPDRKGGKMDSKSPGGMAIVLTTTGDVLHLVVQRCGVDSDTVLKASSERAILRRLDEALRIWQKVRVMK